MNAEKNRQVLLARRPVGEPTASDFELAQKEVPVPREGEVLCKTIYLSLDPYMRGRMNETKSYAEPVPIGGVMEGGTVSSVVSSKNQSFAEGDIVVARTGWQDYAAVPGSELRKVDPSMAPISTAVGVLGMPGMTAYTGLLNIGQPKHGETVVVAAASGAVGSIVGQIAKIKGCKTVGIAGSTEKCDYVTQTLGFDACLNHTDSNFASRLSEECNNGIDVYFENVGGKVWESVLPLLNMFARVPVCGLISHYNATSLPDAPNRVPELMFKVLTHRLTLRGFIVRDYDNQQAEFLSNTANWLKNGDIQYREDFVDGLETAPEALIGLLKGNNFGKVVVRVSPDPTT